MSIEKPFRVDFHAHIIARDFPNFAEKYSDSRFPIVKHQPDGSAEMYRNDKPFRTIFANAWDSQTRLAEMDEEGIDVQVLSPIPVTFTYWAKPNACLELSQFQNDHIATVTAEYPDRFVGLGTVPLQDTDLAIEEMRRAVQDLGLKGIQIGSNVNGRNLDDPEIVRFLETAGTMNVPILVHPWVTVGQQRMPRHNFMYAI